MFLPFNTHTHTHTHTQTCMTSRTILCVSRADALSPIPWQDISCASADLLYAEYMETNTIFITKNRHGQTHMYDVKGYSFSDQDFNFQFSMTKDQGPS